MNLRISRSRWALGSVALVAALALVALAPRLGFTTGAPSPLWTERPLTATPPTAVPPSPWIALAHDLKPAVVNISTKRTGAGVRLESPLGNDDPFNEFFKQFFGNQPRQMLRSLGSGFIVNPDGYIVTNNHVIDGATEIKVTLSDGRELAAKVLGRDPKTDLALLKVEAHGLPVIPLGDSTALQIGEPVMAIGNPFGLSETVTTGIVSATGRVIGEGPYDDFIQTDASINPGNSGGPLINTRGQAVGINTAIFTRSGGSVGIGFAIPINLAKPVVTQLAASGHVTRGWLGVTIQRVTPELAKSFRLPETRGALVSAVVEGSPAQTAGLKPGDVIVAYNGRTVARSDELPRAVAATPVGREVPLSVLRDGKTVALTAKIARLAEADEAASPASGEKPRLGLQLQTLTPKLAAELGLRDRSGVLVRGVEDGSPAAGAGLRPGDVIAEIDHRPVKNVEDLKETMARHAPGTPTLLLVHREHGNLYIAIGS